MVSTAIVLRSSIILHFQIFGRHSFDRMEVRGVERGSVRRSERTREGHCQLDEHWNCFKDNIEETSERRVETHTGLSEYIDTTLN